jgi:thiol-disulfide isomerase/thioredoxin
MRHRLVAFASVLGCVITLAAAAAASPQGKPLTAKLQRLEGGNLQLSDLRGNPVLLELWATWCGPCRIQKDLLEQQAELLAKRGVTVLAVNQGESRDRIEQFPDLRGGRFPVVLDRGQLIATRLRIDQLPALVLLRSDGTVVAQRMGLVSRQELENLLDLLAPD